MTVASVFDTDFSSAAVHVTFDLTFNVFLFLPPPEKVNDVFRVGHTVHKFLAEARSVERLEAAAVVYLLKYKRQACARLLFWLLFKQLLQRQPSHPQANERLLRDARTSDSFSLSLF